MHLTRYGLQGAVFLLLMYGAFFATPYSNLFFLLLSFLTLQWLVGVVAGLRNVRGVTAELEALEPVPAGERVELAAELRAPERARYQLRVVLSLEDGRSLVGTLPELQERGSVTLTSKGLGRGCHAVRRAHVESRHPFGLLVARAPLAAGPELVVYPAPARLLEGRSAADALDELLGRSQVSAGDLQPAGLRDHREGDDVRSIHWRASARRGDLVVREWEGGGGRGLELLLDRRCTPEALEEALSTIVAVLHLARTNKETLTLHSQDLSATFGSGQRPWAELLRFLALAEVVPADGLAPPVVSPAVARLPRAASTAAVPSLRPAAP